MTALQTLDEIHAAIDETPGDFSARLVLADLLEEMDDPRAMGYRALAACRRKAYRSQGAKGGCWWMTGVETFRSDPECIPMDWFDAAEMEGKRDQFIPDYTARSSVENPCGRREVEDAVALAFTKLPPERQAELLQGKMWN